MNNYDKDHFTTIWFHKQSHLMHTYCSTTCIQSSPHFLEWTSLEVQRKGPPEQGKGSWTVSGCGDCPQQSQASSSTLSKGAEVSQHYEFGKDSQLCTLFWIPPCISLQACPLSLCVKIWLEAGLPLKGFLAHQTQPQSPPVSPNLSLCRQCWQDGFLKNMKG